MPSSSPLSLLPLPDDDNGIKSLFLEAGWVDMVKDRRPVFPFSLTPGFGFRGDERRRWREAELAVISGDGLESEVGDVTGTRPLSRWDIMEDDVR